MEALLTAKFTPLCAEVFPGRPVVEPNVVYCNMVIPGQQVFSIPHRSLISREIISDRLLVRLQHNKMLS